jgi:hypothetical protein
MQNDLCLDEPQLESFVNSSRDAWLRAQECGFIKGLAADLLDDGVAIIQYADDTIFMFEDDFESARNLKLILCIFEQLTGLKIKLNKSEVSCFGKATDSIDVYARIFTCKVGMFPFWYLGVPMHF